MKKYNNTLEIFIQISKEIAYIELEKQCRDIIIIGFSMGGLIGANICENHNVKALILINTPIYFWDIKRIIKNLFSDFPLFIKKYFSASVSKPLPILFEFLTLLNKTKPFFSNINCPTLIVQTLDDDTVNPKSADYIFSKLKGQKLLKKYENGGHLVFLNEVGIIVAKDICEFLNEIN